MEKDTYVGVTRSYHQSRFSLWVQRGLALGLILLVAFALFWVGMVALFVGLGIAIVGAGIRFLLMKTKPPVDSHVLEGDYTEVHVERKNESVRD